MWYLGRLLPLILGNVVPHGDQNWECFLLLLRVVDYVFAPVISHDITSYLKIIIKEHHELFQQVYPSCPVIP